MPVQHLRNVPVLERGGESVHGSFTVVGADRGQLFGEQAAAGVERFDGVRAWREFAEAGNGGEFGIYGGAVGATGKHAGGAGRHGGDGDRLPGPVEDPQVGQRLPGGDVVVTGGARHGISFVA